MQKQRSVHVTAVCFAAGILAVTGLLAGCSGSKSGDSFRSVQIYELEGSAEIEREGSGVVNAVENLYLEAQDRVKVAADSAMRLKLDDDKYMLAEENTVFAIRAKGSAKDSETTIELEQGGFTSEIQNPLSKDSQYEVETPNSVMAVRGTIFRVEVQYDQDGKPLVKVTTFEGKVSSQRLLADGTYGDELSIESGSEVVIYSDSDGTKYLGEPTKTDYHNLPPDVLTWLHDQMEQGAEIDGITKEELDELLKGNDTSKKEKNAAAADDKAKTVSEEGKKSEKDSSAADDNDEETGHDRAAKSRNTGTAGNPGGNGGTGAAGNPGGNGESGAAGNPGGNGESGANENPGGNDESGANGNPGGNDESGANENPGNSGDSEENKNPQDDKTEDDGKGGGDKEPEQPKPPEDTVDRCTVKFYCQGKIFATQTVEYGKKAAVPKLSPSSEGGWDFDFSKAIRKNTTIYWKAGK